jgi:hypothetical protein
MANVPQIGTALSPQPPLGEGEVWFAPLAARTQLGSFIMTFSEKAERAIRITLVLVADIRFIISDLCPCECITRTHLMEFQ